MRKLLIAATALLASPALAADKGGPTIRDSALTPTCHVMAMGGFTIAAADVSDGAGVTIPFAATGATGSVGAGCDLRLAGGFLIGVQGDYSLGKSTAKIQDPAGTAELSLDRAWTIGGRLGYFVQSTTLLFASLGYTQAQAEAKDAMGKLDTTLNGITLGGGLETKIAEPVWFRFEALHTLYSREKIDALSNVEAASTAVRAGIVVRF